LQDSRPGVTPISFPLYLISQAPYPLPRIDYPQVLNAMHLQPIIYNRQRIISHFAGADRMINRFYGPDEMVYNALF
jgi:hypothetical protein